jgi:hypothetical protein
MKPTAIDKATQTFDALPMDKLREGTPQPTRDEAIQAIAGCINSRTGQWKRSKPKGTLAGLLWDLVRFHKGNGSLWGFPWFADSDTRDRIDTLALVLLGGKSNAADAWGRALR